MMHPTGKVARLRARNGASRMRSFAFALMLTGVAALTPIGPGTPQKVGASNYEYLNDRYDSTSKQNVNQLITGAYCSVNGHTMNVKPPVVFNRDSRYTAQQVAWRATLIRSSDGATVVSTPWQSTQWAYNQTAAAFSSPVQFSSISAGHYRARVEIARYYTGQGWSYTTLGVVNYSESVPVPIGSYTYYYYYTYQTCSF